MCGCENTLNDTPSLALMQTPNTINYKITELKEIDTNKIGNWFGENKLIGGIVLMGIIGGITYKVNKSKTGEL
jgi:hypothetical protein